MVESRMRINRIIIDEQKKRKGMFASIISNVVIWQHNGISSVRIKIFMPKKHCLMKKKRQKKMKNFEGNRNAENKNRNRKRIKMKLFIS